MQKPLSGDFAPRNRRILSVFDETLPELGRQPFLGSAVVLVDREWIDWLQERLRAARLKSGYQAELKYRSLGDARASRLAGDWLGLLLNDARHCLALKVFVTDLEGAVRLPYPGDAGWDENLWRHLLAAYTGALTWSYPAQDQIDLAFVFDATGNAGQRHLQARLPAGLQRRFLERALSKPKLYSPLRTTGVEWLESKPGGDDDEWAKRELIQMADVLLGAIVRGLKPQAMDRRVSGRIEFSESLFEQLARETNAPRWIEWVPMHRRISASLYPDANNFAYPALYYKRRAIEQGEQLKLNLTSTPKRKGARQPGRLQD